MPSQVKTGLTSWTFTAPLIPWFLFTIQKMKESKESWLTTKTSCRAKPENSFHSHRGSPITATATNPVFRKAHLYTYTLAVARAITFPATPTSLAWNVLFSSRRCYLAQCLAYSAASPVAVALPSTSTKLGVYSQIRVDFPCRVIFTCVRAQNLRSQIK